MSVQKTTAPKDPGTYVSHWYRLFASVAVQALNIESCSRPSVQRAHAYCSIVSTSTEYQSLILPQQ